MSDTRCPKCGSERNESIRFYKGNHRWLHECGSCFGGTYFDGKPLGDYQSDRCRISEQQQTIAKLTEERDALKAEVERLNALIDEEGDAAGRIFDIYTKARDHIDSETNEPAGDGKWRIKAICECFADIGKAFDEEPSNITATLRKQLAANIPRDEVERVAKELEAKEMYHRTQAASGWLVKEHTRAARAFEQSARLVRELLEGK